MKELEVTIDNGLVGFRNEHLFNPKSEFGVDAEYIKKCYDEFSRKHNYVSTWLKIHDTLLSNGIYPSWSILTIAVCLFELDKKLVIRPILVSMKKHASDYDHLFHDFSVIKIAYLYSKEGYEVKFGINEDLFIDGLKIEVKRRMGVLKNREIKKGKVGEMFLRGVEGNFPEQVENALDKQKADVVIYDVATDICGAGIIFLSQLLSKQTYTDKLPRLQKGTMLLFSSRQMRFLDITKGWKDGIIERSYCTSWVD